MSTCEICGIEAVHVGSVVLCALHSHPLDELRDIKDRLRSLQPFVRDLRAVQKR